MIDDRTQDLIPSAFLHSPGFLLNQAGRLIASKIEDSLKPAGLNLQQFGLMRIIAAEGPITQNVFAAKYNVDRTTVTEIVDGMEERGLVSRQKSVKDRRCNDLHLTPGGKKLLARAQKLVEKTNHQYLAVLSDSEWEQMRASLVKLISASLE
ncbi:MAG: MarR family transcriptional regulator [Candidatus Melainabacteria bacterium]|nr:MarR family transcriptional regulator [Candidatus Melainabacteria bacterium]